MKKGLVLSGGSVKGAFQAGAIAELLRSERYQPEGIFGISTGALNGAFMADRAGRQLKDSPNIDWVDVGNSLEQFWIKNVRTQDDLVEKRKGVLFSALFKSFKGLLKTERLRAIVDKEIKLANIQRFSNGRDRVFSIGAVDLWSGQIVYADHTSKSLIDFVFASAAIPLVFPEVRIPVGLQVPSPFVDGGVRDLAPVRRIIKDTDFKEVTAIICQPKDYVGSTFNTGNIIKTIERLLDIILAEALENDIEIALASIELAKENDHQWLKPFNSVPKPRLIRPDAMNPILDVDILEFNSTNIIRMINLGRRTVNPNAAQIPEPRRV